PLGLSSGRFPSVFPTLPDPFSVPFPVGSDSVFESVAVGEPFCRWLPFGFLLAWSRVYQSFSVDLTDVFILINRKDASCGMNFPEADKF
ncbi:hypothetical protein, partial [Streptomyces sp. Da 82-17]|uniref:hypothetical protein n=1 Tax=Streptomyces sp. Da 82-17 TaxID=3377116 RepID=UPI0038D4996C